MNRSAPAASAPAGTPRKTIVLCCNSLWGLVNFRGRAVQALAADGHRVVLVGVPDAPLTRVADLGAEFVEWHVAPRGLNPFHEFAALRELTRIYRRLAPDIAFHFTVKPVLYGALAARRTGSQVVSAITGLGYLFLSQGPRQWLAHVLYRATIRHSREVWFLNADDREIFARAGLTEGVSAQTLPGEGVDTAHFDARPLPPSTHGFVFLMMARLLRDKGVVEFADAARIVRGRFPQARFQLLGPSYDANDMSVSIATVKAWQAEGILEYLGSVDDVRPAVAAAHCVVLPSYREGMPRVLMEAAAMGRPAVATDVVGCRDVVVAGSTGWLCAPKSAPALADALIEALSTPPSQLAAMASRARQLAVDRFDDAHIIRRYRDIVASI